MSEKPTYAELEQTVKELKEQILHYKGVEEDLRRSAEKHRSMINDVNDGFFNTDKLGALTFSNTALAQMYGYDNPQELIGKNFLDLVEPQQRNKILQRFSNAIQNGEFTGATVPVTTLSKDGNQVFIELRATPIKEGEQVVGTQGIIRDVTERKRTERALRESENKYRTLFESSANPITILDWEGIVLMVNAVGAQNIGLPLQACIGKSVFDLFPDLDDSYRLQIEQVVDKGIEVINESCINLPSGKRWFWSFLNPISDSSGRRYAAQIISHDITERKRTEVALRESEEKYRSLVENTPDAIISLDTNGKITGWNKGAVGMFRFKAEEIMGKHAGLLAPEELRDEQREIIGKLREKGIIEGYETIRVSKDGTQIPVEMTLNKREDAQGAFIGTSAIIRNITERKQAEEALLESESKLRQAQKMESIGTLAGGIAHEFNNILGIIIGNTELAIDDVPEWNPAKECLKEIRTASIRAKDVVRHILSFARKTPAQRKPIQISTIIRDSLKLMRASIPTTIEIRQNIACESEMILADPTEINQVLMNLCTNSVHALSEETGVLEVTLENEELRIKNEELGLEAGRYVKLTVKDSGEGIDPKIMDRIFDPYFTTKDIGEGTGMGLAVAYGIVKKHDGAIKASSEPGIGTVVVVLFPLIEEMVEPEVEAEPQVLPTGTERILFVDDEASLVKMGKQMLGRLGYQVVTKTNPKEALALFKAESDQFDMVITDMAMPQMAGDRFAKELMKIRKDIPIILCTGHSARIDEDRAKELGLAAYAMKPLVMRDFAFTVRKVLDAAKASTQD